MIKKFDQYNESLKDQMTPKSEEDIEKITLTHLRELENKINNDELEAWEMVNKLLALPDVKNARDVLNVLIDNDIVNIHQLIQYIQNDIDKEISGYSKESKLLDILEILFKSRKNLDTEQL